MAEPAAALEGLTALADLARDRDADALQLARSSGTAALVDRDPSDDAVAEATLPMSPQPRARAYVVDTGSLGGALRFRVAVSGRGLCGRGLSGRGLSGRGGCGRAGLIGSHRRPDGQRPHDEEHADEGGE